MNGVVPFSMEFFSFDPKLGHFFICDFNTLLVGFMVQYRLNRQPFGCSGIGNQVDYRVQADERPTSPVLGNVAEHTVLDFVPLARSRGQVADGNGQSRSICQSLQFALP